MKLVLAAALGTLLVAPAYAADVKAGQALVHIWCANCHETEGSKSGNDAAPAFSTIAERHASDPNWVHSWLKTSHPTMPSFNLSRQGIDDIVAYLATLTPEHK